MTLHSRIPDPRGYVTHEHTVHFRHTFVRLNNSAVDTHSSSSSGQPLGQGCNTDVQYLIQVVGRPSRNGVLLLCFAVLQKMHADSMVGEEYTYSSIRQYNAQKGTNTCQLRIILESIATLAIAGTPVLTRATLELSRREPSKSAYVCAYAGTYATSLRVPTVCYDGKMTEPI